MQESASGHHDTAPLGRAIVGALGRSVAIAGLFVVISLAIRGETVTTVLWEAVFCFVAVAVLMLVGLYFTRAGRGIERPSHHSDDKEGDAARPTGRSSQEE